MSRSYKSRQSRFQTKLQNQKIRKQVRPPSPNQERNLDRVRGVARSKIANSHNLVTPTSKTHLKQGGDGTDGTDQDSTGSANGLGSSGVGSGGSGSGAGTIVGIIVNSQVSTSRQTAQEPVHGHTHEAAATVEEAPEALVEEPAAAAEVALAEVETAAALEALLETEATTEDEALITRGAQRRWVRLKQTVNTPRCETHDAAALEAAEEAADPVVMAAEVAEAAADEAADEAAEEAIATVDPAEVEARAWPIHAVLDPAMMGIWEEYWTFPFWSETRMVTPWPEAIEHEGSDTSKHFELDLRKVKGWIHSPRLTFQT
jgi:hypothetical protein